MNSFVSMLGLTAESTSLVEDFSPTSTFHASPKTAFTNLLDLAFALVLHIILFPFKDYSYYRILSIIARISHLTSLKHYCILETL